MTTKVYNFKEAIATANGQWWKSDTNTWFYLNTSMETCPRVGQKVEVKYNKEGSIIQMTKLS